MTQERDDECERLTRDPVEAVRAKLADLELLAILDYRADAERELCAEIVEAAQGPAKRSLDQAVSLLRRLLAPTRTLAEREQVWADTLDFLKENDRAHVERPLEEK